MVTDVITRNPTDETRVDHFLDFLSDPAYLTVASFGSIEMKLSDGDLVRLPNVRRDVHVY